MTCFPPFAPRLDCRRLPADDQPLYTTVLGLDGCVNQPQRQSRPQAGVAILNHATFVEKRCLIDRDLMRKYLMKPFARSLSRFVKKRNVRLAEYVRKFNSKPKTFQQLLSVERDKVRNHRAWSLCPSIVHGEGAERGFLFACFFCTLPPDRQVNQRIRVEKRMLFNAFAERHDIQTETETAAPCGGDSGTAFADAVPTCAHLTAVRDVTFATCFGQRLTHLPVRPHGAERAGRVVGVPAWAVYGVCGWSWCISGLRASHWIF